MLSRTSFYLHNLSPITLQSRTRSPSEKDNELVTSAVVMFCSIDYLKCIVISNAHFDPPTSKSDPSFQKQNKSRQKTKTEEDRARISTKIYRTRVFRVCCTAPLIHPAKHPLFPLYTNLLETLNARDTKRNSSCKNISSFI